MNIFDSDIASIRYFDDIRLMHTIDFDVPYMLREWTDLNIS